MSEAESGNLVTQAEAAERRMTEAGAATAPVQGESVAGALVRIVQQNPNMDLEKVRGMMEIAREWEGEEARKAYLDALARAQSTMPTVTKNAHVYFEGKGDRADTDYRHADYGNLVKTIGPHLTREGFSWDHEIEQKDGRVHVACILSHAAGHQKRVSLNASPDDTGGKNQIQQVKSTVTYLKRATLEAAAGAAQEGDDDDGHGFDASAVELISDEDREGLEKQLDDLGATDDDRAKFISFLAKKTKREIESLADLPVTALPAAKQALAAKRRAQSEAKPAEPEPHAGETVSAPAWYQAKDGSGRYECHGGDPTSPEAKKALYERLSADMRPSGAKWTADEASIARDIAEANAGLIDSLPEAHRDALQAAWAEIPA